MTTRILSIGFMLIAIVLGAFFVLRIKGTIDEEARIKESEKLIIKQLMLIRDAEQAYQTVYGRYTASWDTLVDFIEYGQFPITKRTEKIIELAYGADSSVIIIDTLEVIPVKQYIFEDKHNVYVNAANLVADINFEVDDLSGPAADHKKRFLLSKLAVTGTGVNYQTVAPGEILRIKYYISFPLGDDGTIQS